MSIQDETFPDDEFLDELNFSPTSTQFPHHKHKDRQHAPPMSTSTSTNTSASSATSDPDDGSKKHSNELNNFNNNNNNNNNSSSDANNNNAKRQDNNKIKTFHDIHTAYTKRRYQHVGSKVAVYIANLKAEDEKRKNAKQKFQRHLSMPETLSDATTGSGDVAGMQKIRSPFFSAGELHKMYDFNSDGEVCDLSEENSDRPSSSCNEMSSSADYADKIPQMLNDIERLESYIEHLQTILNEKSSENSCLKRNMHMLRIELCKYQDRLKQQSRQTEMINNNNNFLQAAYLYGQPVWRGQTKATQTEFVLVPLPPPTPQQQQKQQQGISVNTPLTPPAFNHSVCDLYVTPETPDKNSYDDNNNNNSNQYNLMKEGIKPSGPGNTNSSATTSTTTTTAAAAKYQIKRMQLLTDDEDEIRVEEEEHEEGEEDALNAPIELSSYKRNSKENDAGTSTTLQHSELNNEITSGTASSTTKRKRRYLRKSWFNIFRPCVSCKEDNHTVNHNNNNSSSKNNNNQSYTQVPLLETSML